MNSLDDELQLAMTLEPNAVSEAALIWARATALRDQRTEPPTGEEKMPGIQRRLNLEGSKLLLASRDDTCVGFTLFAPREESLEIFYLAVAPDSWGSGVASTLLVGAEDYARSIGRATLELWVINDNERALSVYARSGFVGTEQVKRDESSGQIERRLLKQI
ncbi:GNAT family N-acetyltransferase [Arthrobacter glacialis]|uniref:GNAT family N-acetyltransferase n=1 Tax=Arthrobacter glacialis TaxID=1664 RepID=UPI0013FD6CDE|nr:GNAT family N-acetyltransferase [Arthrobacter glacialis]